MVLNLTADYHHLPRRRGQSDRWFSERGAGMQGVKEFCVVLRPRALPVIEVHLGQSLYQIWSGCCYCPHGRFDRGHDAFHRLLFLRPL
jgi:hypothetical protein